MPLIGISYPWAQTAYRLIPVFKHQPEARAESTAEQPSKNLWSARSITNDVFDPLILKNCDCADGGARTAPKFQGETHETELPLADEFF